MGLIGVSTGFIQGERLLWYRIGFSRAYLSMSKLPISLMKSGVFLTSFWRNVVIQVERKSNAQHALCETNKERCAHLGSNSSVGDEPMQQMCCGLGLNSENVLTNTSESLSVWTRTNGELLFLTIVMTLGVRYTEFLEAKSRQKSIIFVQVKLVVVVARPDEFILFWTSRYWMS